jgi:hypothetical protein
MSGDPVFVTFALHHCFLRFVSLPLEKRHLVTRTLDGAMRMEHRWGERQSTEVTVHLVASSGKTGIARLVNLSVTGAYLETRVPLRLHSLLYLQSHIGGNCVAASVVRLDALGVGLKWCEAMTKQAHVDALLAMLGNIEKVDGLALRSA